jgi:hypothetical protein
VGAWSEEPFGNDTATDWAHELSDQTTWEPVELILRAAAIYGEDDDDLATVAYAAAEVVAHGLGKPTQSDSYTVTVEAYVKRVGTPSQKLVTLASRALDKSTRPSSDLAELWEDDEAWAAAVDRLSDVLEGEL